MGQNVPATDEFQRSYRSYLENRDLGAIYRRLGAFSFVILFAGCTAWQLDAEDAAIFWGFGLFLLILSSSYGILFSVRRLWIRYKALQMLATLPLSPEQRASLFATGLPVGGANLGDNEAAARVLTAPAFAPARLTSDNSSLAASRGVQKSFTMSATTPYKGRRGSTSAFKIMSPQGSTAEQGDTLTMRELGLGPVLDGGVQTAALFDSAARSIVADGLGLTGGVADPYSNHSLVATGLLADSRTQHSALGARAKYLSYAEQQVEIRTTESKRQEPSSLQYLTSSPSASKQPVKEWSEWLTTSRLSPLHPAYAYQAPRALETPAASLRKAVADYFADTWLKALMNNTNELQRKNETAFPSEYLERRPRGTPSKAMRQDSTFGWQPSGGGGVGISSESAVTNFTVKFAGPARLTLDAAMAEAYATRLADLEVKAAYDKKQMSAPTLPQIAAPQAWGAPPSAAAAPTEPVPVPRIDADTAALWLARFELDTFLWPGQLPISSAAPSIISSSGHSASNHLDIAYSSKNEALDVRGYVLARLEDLTGARITDVKTRVRGQNGSIIAGVETMITKLHGQTDPLSSYLGDECALSVGSGGEGFPTDAEILLHFWATMMDEAAAAAGRAEGGSELQIRPSGPNSLGLIKPATTHRLFSSRYIRRAVAEQGITSEIATSFLTTVWSSVTGVRQTGGIPSPGSAHGGEEDVSRRFAIWIPPGRTRSSARGLRPFILVDGIAVDLGKSLPAHEHVPATCALFSLMELWEPYRTRPVLAQQGGVLLSQSLPPSTGNGHGTLCIERGMYVNIENALRGCLGDSAPSLGGTSEPHTDPALHSTGFHANGRSQRNGPYGYGAGVGIGLERGTSAHRGAFVYG